MKSTASGRLNREDRLIAGHVEAVVCVYLFLALLGIPQSSLGIACLQSDGQTSSGVRFGVPRQIRGDEFSGGSPFVLGDGATGTSDVYAPLGQDPSITAATANGGLVEQFSFFYRSLIQASNWLPDRMQFAAYWWLWLAVVAIALPLMVRIRGVPLPLMLLGTAASLISPPAAWSWNFPVRPIALSAILTACIGLAWKRPGHRRPVSLVVLALVAAICLARLPNDLMRRLESRPEPSGRSGEGVSWRVNAVIGVPGRIGSVDRPAYGVQP